MKEALKGITGSRDHLRQDLQESVDRMEMMTKKMAAQEDLVRKAAYTNVSYGKRLEDLTMGLKQKHNDVTAAKRNQLAAEEMADELRIELGKTEKEFEMHREDSVDAQVHKVTVREKEQAEKRMGLLREEIRTLRREMSFNSGQYEGVIEKLDAEFAATKEKLDTKIAEEAEALKHGGTAMQKLKMQVEALELKKRELHAIARSAEKKCKAAETLKEEMEMNQTALQTDAKRAKHAKAFAEEEKAKAVIEATEAKDALYTAVREADARGAQTRAELTFVKEELQKVEQQRTMVVQLLGLLRRLQNRTKEQPLAEELQDCKCTSNLSATCTSRGQCSRVVPVLQMPRISTSTWPWIRACCGSPRRLSLRRCRSIMSPTAMVTAICITSTLRQTSRATATQWTTCSARLRSSSGARCWWRKRRRRRRTGRRRAARRRLPVGCTRRCCQVALRGTI